MSQILSDKIYNIAFVGLRHPHIFELYNMAESNEKFNVVGAFESDNDSVLIAKDNGVVINYSSFDEVLNDSDVDIIAIGDYFSNRGTLALKSLEHGKHVICDKPLCTSLDELSKIKALSQEKSLCVSCMYTMRYDAITYAAKEAMELIGDVKSVYFGGQHPLNYGTRPSWYFEPGKHGGLFNDLAIHGVDLIYFLCEQRIARINSARTYNAYAIEEPDFKDSGQFMAELTNGAGLIADVSYSVPNSAGFNFDFYWQFYIWGENGVISFSANSKEVLCYVSSQSEPIRITAKTPPANYLDDFYTLLLGGNPILPMTDTFDSTYDALSIENASR